MPWKAGTNCAVAAVAAAAGTCSGDAVSAILVARMVDASRCNVAAGIDGDDVIAWADAALEASHIAPAIDNFRQRIRSWPRENHRRNHFDS